MAPALDLIVVEHLIKHKGKEIRRVTEVSEVRSYRKGREIEVNFFHVFDWDAKTDSFSEMKSNNILELISNSAGIELERIMRELKIRESVLDYLVSENITARKELKEMINKYYGDKEGFIKMIVGD